MSVGRGEDDDTCAMYNVMHLQNKSSKFLFSCLSAASIKVLLHYTHCLYRYSKYGHVFYLISIYHVDFSF